jgi:hypothetical protein
LDAHLIFAKLAHISIADAREVIVSHQFQQFVNRFLRGKLAELIGIQIARNHIKNLRAAQARGALASGLVGVFVGGGASVVGFLVALPVAWRLHKGWCKLALVASTGLRALRKVITYKGVSSAKGFIVKGTCILLFFPKIAGRASNLGLTCGLCV